MELLASVFLFLAIYLIKPPLVLTSQSTEYNSKK